MARLTKNERRRNTAVGTATGEAGKFLVVGTAISETVVHQPRGGERRGIGGVAVTIALALAEAGNQVTLVTSVGRGTEGRRVRDLLAETAIRAVIQDSPGPAGHAVINTRGGEQCQASGRWPKQEGLSRLVTREAGNHDCIIADCNITPAELARILDQPGRLTMVNGTTARGCARILKAGLKDLGMLTVNEAEASAMMRAIPTVWESKLMMRLNAHSMLVTRGHNGWDLHRSGEETVRSPAVEVPDHTDFIGCGDYAAAGAVHALVHGLDPELTINRFVRRKLEANVVTPPNPGTA